MSGPDDIYDGTVAEVRAMTAPTPREVLPCGYVFGLTGATCGQGPDFTLHRAGSYDAKATTPVHDYTPTDRRSGAQDRRAALTRREPLDVERLARAMFADLTTLPWDDAPEGLRRGSLTKARSVAAEYARQEAR